MNYTLISFFGCLGLFLGMLLFAWLGYLFGRHQIKKGTPSPESSGLIVGSIFALLGLLLAFTFNGAFTRLDNRRQLIVQEANAIGTAYLRLELLPADAQTALRQDFRNYTLSRAKFYQFLTEDSTARAEHDRALALQTQIWTQAVAASSDLQDQSVRLLLLPALNEMIDITTTRAVAILTHPPSVIWIILAFISFACTGMAGYSAANVEHPRKFHFIAFAVIIAITVFLILDVEYPRYGLVRLDSVNQLLIDLAETMK